MAEETLSVQITCIVYVVVKNQIQVKLILTYFDSQLTLLGLVRRQRNLILSELNF